MSDAVLGVDYVIARLVQKSDGIYVEFEDQEGIHSAGPLSNEVAEEVRKAIESGKRRN